VVAIYTCVYYFFLEKMFINYGLMTWISELLTSSGRRYTAVVVIYDFVVCVY